MQVNKVAKFEPLCELVAMGWEEGIGMIAVVVVVLRIEINVDEVQNHVAARRRERRTTGQVLSAVHAQFPIVPTSLQRGADVVEDVVVAVDTPRGKEQTTIRGGFGGG